MSPLQRLQFVLIIVCIPIIFALICLVSWEMYLTSKMNKAGVEFKFNEQRVIKLIEIPPGSTVLERMYYDREHTHELVSVGTDNLGFILPSSGYKNPDITLAFMGDSITHGNHIKPEDRYPYFTGKILEERLNLKIRSLNAATSGQDTYQSLNVLINKVLPQSPDYVVILPGEADSAALDLYQGYWNHNDHQNVVRKFSFRLTGKYFKNKFFPNVYAALTDQWAGLRKQWRLRQQQQGMANPVSPCSILRKVPVLPFKHALLSWAKIVESWGSTPVIIFRPVKKTCIENIEAFNQVIRNTVKETRAILIDLEEVTLNCDKHIGEECTSIYADGIHFNKRGSRKVARVLADALEIEIKRCQQKGVVKCF